MKKKIERNVRKKRNKTIGIVVAFLLAIIVIVSMRLINHKENSEEEKVEYDNENRNVVNEVIQDTPETAKKNELESNTNTIQEKVQKEVEFDNEVAFIGDSRTQGFIGYVGLKDVIDYSNVGLMVDTALTKKFVKTVDGNKITIIEDMKAKNLKKVYIMLGINELGWKYSEVFVKKYGELIDEIRKVQPNCQIYVQSIIPVTKEKSESDEIYNNANIQNYNRLIKQLARDKNVIYLDVASALMDEEGNLPKEASTEGIHINKKYSMKWLEYLKVNS